MSDYKDRMNEQFRDIPKFQNLYLLQDKFDYDVLRKLWTVSIKSLKK